MNYRTKVICIMAEDGTEYSFIGRKLDKLKLLISAMNAMGLLNKGCTIYSRYAMKSEKGGSEFSSIPVVEFLDVLPYDFSGLPLDREVIFFDDLEPDMAPILRGLIEWHLRKCRNQRIN